MTPEQTVAAMLISVFGVFAAMLISIQDWKTSLKQAAVVAVVISLSFAIAKVFI